MAQDEPSFHYDSLLQGRYVRLLMIEPPEADKPSSILRVSLVEQPLDTAEFDALSYVWGDQTQKFRIICNGQNHSIGQSLHEALTEYRRRGSTRGLWADAICINQACEAEKSSQVQMMGDIYGAACRTIIWLGQIQPHDMDGIAIAEMSYARRSREDDSTDGSDVSFDSFNCRSRGLPEVLVGNNPHPSWKSLYSILTHPWFSRIWVVQELLLSRDPVMWRGDRSVDTEAMLWMAGQISGRVDLIILRDFDDLPEFYANNIALCRSRYRTFGSLPIWISMAHNIAMEATHIIDRYFALAGICTGQPSDFVNYSKTLEEVATQVGLMTLLDTPDYPTPDGLDRLADRPSLRLRSQQVRIPSWIPDCLSKPLMGLPISRTYNTENLRHQQTSFPRPEFQVVTDDLEKEPKFPFANLKVRELQIKGTILDRIKAVLPPIEEGWIPNQSNQLTGANRVQDLRAYFERYYRYSAKMIRFIGHARLLADPQLTHQDEIVSGDSFEDFWRTLCYNRTGSDLRQEKRPKERVGVSFGYWFLMSKLFLTRRWEQDLFLFVRQHYILSQLVVPFASSFDRMYGSRSFFVSENGRIGWAPLTACPGDSIGVFRGNRIPFVSRLVRDHVWEYAGGCYVHGCMDGEISGKDDVDWRFLRFV